MIREADYVIVESTYGDRLHKSKDDTVLEMLSILKKTQQEKGVVIMPVFALERAQEIIYELNLFYESKLMEAMPVYLDSPMAIEATQIFKQYPNYYDEDAKRLLAKGDDPFNFKELHFVRDSAESMRLIDKYNVVLMAGSGMCTGGRVVNHLMNNLNKRNAHVVFVGYQVKGTLGRRLVDGEPTVRIRGKTYEVQAQIHTLGGFSAHADERDLRFWMRGFGRSPRRIFVCHGEESVAIGFASNLAEELRVDTHVPNMFETVELE
jgi:metallo-beta-lactamase family protein